MSVFPSEIKPPFFCPKSRNMKNEPPYFYSWLVPITKSRCTLKVLCVFLGGLAEYFQIILALYVLDIRRKLLHSALDSRIALSAREVECVIKTYSVAEVFVCSASIILGKEKMGFTTSFSPPSHSLLFVGRTRRITQYTASGMRRIKTNSALPTRCSRRFRFCYPTNLIFVNF